MTTEILALEVREDGTRVVTRKIDGMGRSAIKADNDVTRMQKTLKNFKNVISPIKLVSAALAGVSIAMAVFRGFDTIRVFSQEMSTLGAITGATGEQFDQLRERAKELGSTTRFSATQAAAGMTFLARAGFDADESIIAIKSTLNLAQSGALGLAEAADIASNVLKGFRLEVGETDRVVDTLARVANLANTNVSQLGQAMSFVAPVAAGLGVSVEVTASAIGALSDAGIQSTRAGTGLKKILTELQNPGSAAAKVFKDLGIRTDELQISNVGLVGALRRLNEAGITATQGMEAFGLIAGPAFEVLNSSLVNGDLPITKATLEATKTAAEFAKEMDDNLNGAVLATASAFEGLVLAIGDLGVESGLKAFFFGLADAIRSVSNNLEDLVTTAKIFFGIMSVLRIKAISASLVTLGKRFLLVNAIMAANPIGLVVTAIAVAVSALFFFRDEINLASQGFISLRNFAVAAFEIVVEKVQPIIDKMKELFENITKGSKAAFQNIGIDLNDVLVGVKKFLNLLIAAFIGGTDVIYKIFETAFINIGRIFTDEKFIGVDEFAANLDATLTATFNKDYVGNFISPIVAGFDLIERRAKVLQAQQDALAAVNAGAFGSPIDDVKVKDEVNTENDGEKSRASVLSGINDELRKEAELLQIASPFARELKMQLLSIGQELEGKNIFLDENQLTAEFGHLLLSNQMLAQRAEILDRVKGPQEEFENSIKAIASLTASGALSDAQGTNLINDITGGLLEGTAELQSTYVQQWTDTYQQISDLRDLDLISETTANQLRARADVEQTKQRLSAHKEAFTALATLAGSENRKLAAVGKAAAVTQATIDGVLGVQKALASAPPPINFVLAAAVGVAAAANVAKIASSRALGGDLNAGQVSRVGESSFSRPEMFTGASGNQFFIPNERGRIEPLSQSAPPSAAPAATAQGRGTTELTIVNVFDPSLITQWAESEEGEDAVINIIDRQAGQVNQLLGN